MNMISKFTNFFLVVTALSCFCNAFDVGRLTKAISFRKLLPATADANTAAYTELALHSGYLNVWNLYLKNEIRLLNTEKEKDMITNDASDRPSFIARVFDFQSQQSNANALCVFKETITNWPGYCSDFIYSGWDCNSEAVATSYPCGSGSMTWSGITCSGGAVSQINLDNCGFEGKISPQMSELTALTYLSIRFSSLTGSIPSEMSTLTNLEYLDLSSNGITSSIPSHISSLINLNGLDLSFNGITSSIPSHISSLTKLWYLDLSSNGLTSSITSQISTLRALQYLSLSSNGLTSSIPTLISTLTNLDGLDLSSNMLTSSIPTQIAALTKLNGLDLSSNILTSSIPSHISSLMNLNGLDLSLNGITSSIPSHISSLTNLEHLDLSDNGLTSSIPSHISSLVSLQYLDLSSSILTSSLPPQISTLTNLNRFSLSRNGLTSSIPSQISTLTNIWYLDLSHNSLSGSIPSHISTLINVGGLSLSFNSLFSSIPSHISTLTNLRILYLDENSLTNSIPSQISTLTKVFWLDLSDNCLSSSIPSHISTLKNLKYLELGSNSLTSSIPSQISILTSLNELTLSFNGLISTIPSRLSTLTNLRYLDLASNSLIGSIPIHISALTNLYSLFLSSNRLTNSVPAQISTLISLSGLDLSWNGLTNSIPSQISTLTNLYRLNLYMNRLSSSIPSRISTLRTLEWLELSRNELTSSLPSQISTLTRLEYLELYTNKMISSIPSRISTLTNLKKLNLNDNRLTSSIPSRMSTLTNLDGLDLSKNKLTSTIPSQISTLTNLVSLELSDNRLTGSISSRVSTWTYLQVLDLSVNKLTSSMQSRITTLTNLISLDLSSNSLVGSIPTNISVLTNLYRLDLSNNGLTSSIPTQILTLTNLAYLDLSYNKLMSSIPSLISNLTYLNVLDLSYNRLTNSIPILILTLTNLELLDLAGNSFVGSILTQISLLSNLNGLDLSSNLLTSSIPIQISILTNLEFLYLSDNLITSSIPSQISNIAKLQLIDLSTNGITSSIPTQISTLTRLQFLDLSNNRLTSSIPSCISTLTNVSALVLSFNRLSSSIPTQISTLTILQFLDLSSNNFVGSIPIHISTMVNLDTMLLSNNKFSSSIPGSLCTLPSASKIDFNNNSFSCYTSCFRKAEWVFDSLLQHCPYSTQDQGICAMSDELDIPTIMNNLEFAASTSIEFESSHPRVRLTENQPYTLVVASPDAFAYEISFDSKTYSDLYDYIRICSDSSCNIIYASYGFERNLFPGILGNDPLRINASTFYIEGDLVYEYDSTYGFLIYITPYTRGLGWNCLKDIDGMYYAKGLCENGLEWTGVYCNLNTKLVQSLVLSNLGIKGTLNPSVIKNLNYLEKLDLSFNKLSGSIPTQIQSIANLKHLDMSSNMLTGILIDFSFLPQISLISLRNNLLTGPISDSFLSITSLKTLQLEANSFNGFLSTSFCFYDSSTLTLSLSGNPDLCYPDCWISLYPSDKNPVCYPNTPSSSITSMIIGVAVGVLVLILSISIYFIYFKRRELELKDKKKQRRLEDLPIHRIIILGRNYSSRELNDVIMRYQSTAVELDEDNNSVMDLIFDTPYAFKNVEKESLYKIAVKGLPFDPITGKVINNNENGDNKYCKRSLDMWAKLVQSEDPKATEVVSEICSRYKKHILLLANSKDKMGRKSIEIASLVCKDIMRKNMYLSGRYELLHVEHDSHTSIVWIGIDHGVADENDPNRHVALKFMKEKSLFDAEINLRSKYNFSPDYVINVLKAFNGEGIKNEESIESYEDAFSSFTATNGDNGDIEEGLDTIRNVSQDQLVVKYNSVPVNDSANDVDKKDSENIEFRKDAKLKGFEDYPFCAIMPNGGQSLQKLILQQRKANIDLEAIRFIMKQLCICVNHIHSKGVVHGDLKPLNILSKDMNVRLIDFDSSVDLNKGDLVSPKFSTAFIPPEMFDDNMFIGTSASNTATASGNSSNASDSCRADAVMRATLYKSNSLFPSGFKRIEASHYVDMWSLGVILFILCTGNVGLGGVVNIYDDLVEEEDMEKIRNWTPSFKIQKLSKVSDKYARNLLSILLSKEPTRRLSTEAVLNHPFITGNKATTRLRGDAPKFDVFLSYRVDSDADHVENLYDELVRRNLSVWWDKKSLPPGYNWEQGFCSGMVNSLTFACLISREAVNSLIDKRNITKLTASSNCDNVMLEWRLAKELYDMGMMSGIYPLLYGDKDPLTFEYSDYFKSDCNPRFTANESVLSIEDKLKEHLEREGLGCPLTDNMTIKDLFNNVCSHQGHKIEKKYDEAIIKAADAIQAMVAEAKI